MASVGTSTRPGVRAVLAAAVVFGLACVVVSLATNDPSAVLVAVGTIVALGAFLQGPDGDHVAELVRSVREIEAAVRVREASHTVPTPREPSRVVVGQTAAAVVAIAAVWIIVRSRRRS